jgi:hypothetical protein
MIQFKYLISLFLIGFALNAQNSELIFDDRYGNSIKVIDFQNISDNLDSDFFIQNLDGKQISSENNESDLRFDFIISDFKKINRNNYKFKVTSYPKTKDPETLIKYMGGGQYFKLNIKRTQSGIELKDIKYLYSVI